ncbi:MAG: hypothetical protein ACMXYD_00700 [Candidatus Woesearchaeota archaeon]
MAKVAVDTPLAELTLRKYERPSPSLSQRELAKKICLSLGVLQPGDSRDVIVDVLYVLLRAEKPLTSKEIEHATIDARQAANVAMLGVASSNIRRQVLRLRDVFLVEKVKNTYRIRENQNLVALFEEHIESYVLQSTVERIKEYLLAAQKKIRE